MTILFPPDRVAARWRGARNTRLRFRPLDAFMRTHALEVAVNWQSTATEILGQLTTQMLELTLSAGREDIGELRPADYLTLGCVACATAEALSGIVGARARWRGAAETAIAHHLNRVVGAHAAAEISNAAVLGYHHRQHEFAGILDAVVDAVEHNDSESFDYLCSAVRNGLCPPSDAGSETLYLTDANGEWVELRLL